MTAAAQRTGLAAALAFVLFLSACGSTNRSNGELASEPSSTSAATDVNGSPVATDAAGDGASNNASGAGARVTGAAGSAAVPGGKAPAGPGVKPVTSPIELGFVRTSVSNARQFGVDLGEIQTISESSAIKAVVDAYNEAGGIVGRKIIPVYADTDTATNRWEADFAAACATFTQDHHVEAVLGYVFDFQPALEDCLKRNNVPHLSTTFNVPDAKLMAHYPLMLALSTPRIERRSITKIEGAMRTGVLKKTNRFGVLMDECSYTIRSWNETVLPYIKKQGLLLAASERFTCARGAGDNGAAVRDLQAAILKFRTANVDRVMIHGVSEGPPLLLFTHEANSQGYSPLYIVSSLANAAVLAGQMPENQARNVHGYGWMPAQDVPPQKWPAVTSSGKRCIDMVRKQGLKPSTAADYSYVLNTCEAVFLYERALRTRKGHSDGPPVVGVLEGVGTSFVSALNLEGGALLTPDVHDTPSRYRYFAWDDGCSCYTYRQSSHAIPSVR